MRGLRSVAGGAVVVPLKRRAVSSTPSASMEPLSPSHFALLLQPVEGLDFSAEFLHMCRVNNFEHIEDLLQIPVYKLLEKPLFGYRMLKEWMLFLERYQLTAYLEE
jgi:DNA-directed RNA polymerase alpha subunit